MRLPYFEYHEPATLGEALALLAEHRGALRILGGGTELLSLMKFGLRKPSQIISLGNLPSLRGISSENGALRIGAMTTLAELSASDEIRGTFNAIHEAVESVAAPPIRNVATIGGNLCQNSRCLFYNQSEVWREEKPLCFKAGGDVCLAVPGGRKCFSVYQGDLAPALMGFGARIKVEKKGSSRAIPLEDIFTGEAKHPMALSNDELITQVLLPVPEGKVGSAYRKMRMRSAVDYPLISVAAVLSLNGRGTIGKARLVLGAAGPAPSVVHEAGAMLLGKDPRDIEPDTVGQAVARGAQMVNNLELPASYRRRMIPVFAGRAIEAAIRSVQEKERT